MARISHAVPVLFTAECSAAITHVDFKRRYFEDQADLKFDSIRLRPLKDGYKIPLHFYLNWMAGKELSIFFCKSAVECFNILISFKMVAFIIFESLTSSNFYIRNQKSDSFWLATKFFLDFHKLCFS